MSESELKEALEDVEEERSLRIGKILEGNPLDKGDLDSSNKSEAFKEGIKFGKGVSDDLPSFPLATGSSNGGGSINH